MNRRYNAFLIRYWTMESDNIQRVEVTHIRSGEKALVVSLESALGWMRGLVAAQPDAERVGEDAGWPGGDGERGF